MYFRQREENYKECKKGRIVQVIEVWKVERMQGRVVLEGFEWLFYVRFKVFYLFFFEWYVIIQGEYGNFGFFIFSF